ncbi:hypothetical protein PsYK624_111480 [Phanerochaete sordida]|uniref:Uncharacterized protein n=1 Tax=Phanerochaete sordida TaxID=48140 RepID=A0A9P3GHD6_9APHY|nr:hypothetical protein PsYK624_111480 [Phanerochaete sordida]
MPSRLTDETRGLVSEAFGVHGFGDRRISHTLFARDRAPKRRQADNLNSRFDRMIHTVNVMHTPADREPKRRRRASSTSGSSSLAGWDAPPTPGAYTELQEPAAGKARGRVERNRRYEGMPDPELHFFGAPRVEEEEMPPWLSSTVAALQSNHPLRDLIPADNAHIPSGNATLVQELLAHHAPVEEEVFAFQPPSPQPTVFDEPVPYADPDLVEDFERGTHFPTLIRPEPLRRIPSPAPLPAHPSARAPPHLPDPLADSQHFHARRPSPPARSAHSTGASIAGADNGAHHPRYQPSFALPSPTAFEFDDSVLHSPPFSKPGPLAPSPVPAARLLVSPPVLLSPSVLDPAHPMPLPFSTPGPLAIGVINPQRVADAANGGTPAFSRAQSSLNPNPRAYRLDQPFFTTNTAARRDMLLDSPLPPSDPESLSSPLPRIQPHQPILHPRHPGHLETARIPDVFSTPGPAARIYFDSPIEDPVGSDPLGPEDYELDLDYANLDFRWEKFERGELPTILVGRQDQSRRNLREEPGKPHPSRSVVPARREPSVVTTDDEFSPEKHPRLENVAENLALAGTPTAGFDGHSQTADEDPLPQDDAPAVLDVHTPQERSAQRPAFAPAPGIYISPLRGSSSADKAGADGCVDESASSKITEATDEEHEILEFSLPRTPTKPAVDAVHTPPRRSGRQRTHSLPPIAVLPRTPSRDSIQDPETSLSQASNDTIESWSAP